MRTIQLPDGRTLDLDYFVEWRPWLGRRPLAEQACREVVNLLTHPRAGLSTARRSVRFIAPLMRPSA